MLKMPIFNKILQGIEGGAGGGGGGWKTTTPEDESGRGWHANRAAICL